VFSTYGATASSLYLDIDREKAQSLGLTINDVFTTLQATLGSYFINYFNLFGRTWQVNLESEAANRRDVPDLWNIYIRNAKGTMVPLQSIASLRTVTGPQVITRYNNYRSVTVDGSPASGVASGTALAAMAEVSAKTPPPGYGFEWTGTAFQEQRASGQTGIVLGDDFHRVHRRLGAVGMGRGRIGNCSPQCQYAGVRRYAGGKHGRNLPDSHALCRVSNPPGEDAEKIEGTADAPCATGQMIPQGNSKLADEERCVPRDTASQVASIAVERPDQELSDAGRFVGQFCRPMSIQPPMKTNALCFLRKHWGCRAQMPPSASVGISGCVLRVQTGTVWTHMDIAQTAAFGRLCRC